IDFCSYMTTDELVATTLKFVGPETMCIGVSTTFWKDINYHHGKGELDPGMEPQWVLRARAAMSQYLPEDFPYVLGGAKPDVLSDKWVIFSGFSEDQFTK